MEDLREWKILIGKVLPLDFICLRQHKALKCNISFVGAEQSKWDKNYSLEPPSSLRQGSQKATPSVVGRRRKNKQSSKGGHQGKCLPIIQPNLAYACAGKKEINLFAAALSPYALSIRKQKFN